MIIGADWGNYETAICTPTALEVFPSDIIPYRVLKVENDLRKYDFIFEYGDRKGLAGTLAKDERNSLHRGRRGDSKLHEDALIRLLIGLHQFATNNVNVVVGQPISKHSRDKARIKDMLEGSHTITVNGIQKTIRIREVAVAAEGAGAYFAHPMPGIVHFIDIGSGTINFATMKNGRFINESSDTVPKGLENLDHNYEAIAESIRNVMIDLEWKDNVYLLGGGAEIMQPYLGFRVVDQPDTANARGFYRIGDSLWGSR